MNQMTAFDNNIQEATKRARTPIVQNEASKPVIKLSIYGTVRWNCSGMICIKGIKGCSGDLLKDVAAKNSRWKKYEKTRYL